MTQHSIQVGQTSYKNLFQYGRCPVCGIELGIMDANNANLLAKLAETVDALKGQPADVELVLPAADVSEPEARGG
jgi:hypothetical protein